MSVGMAEISIELCDGRPSYVKQDLEEGWRQSVRFIALGKQGRSDKLGTVITFLSFL